MYSNDVPTGPAYHSLSVNGTNAYVQVPNSSSLNITGSITLEAWIKLSSVGAYQEIITRESYAQSGTGGGYGLTVTNLGKPRIDLYHTPTTYTPVIGGTSMSTGVWYHVAGVWDGAYLKVYLNGVLDGSTTTGNGPGSGTSSVKIGRNSGGSYFNGLIDEVRVSNAAVYNSNFTPQTHLMAGANTRGLWKFDGQTAADSSTNGNNGTLQGGAVYSDDVPSGDGGGGSGGGSVSQIQWLVPDHLGTPRMIFDQTGSLANMKRHDYLPFGEELFAPTGGRTTAMGYSGGDGIRQQFTSKERDIETGLDYFGARYYSPTQGRFSGVDPGNYQARLDLSAPQSWNAYSYVNNNPLVRVDPDGKGFFDKLKNWLLYDIWGEEADVQREEDKRRQTLLDKQKEMGGVLIIENLGGDWVQVDPVNMSRLHVFFWSNRLMDIHEQGGGTRTIGPNEMVHMGSSMTGSPALKGDPYNPETVRQRQATELTRLRERMQSAGREAERLGFTRRIPAQKAPFNSHGQEVFSNGRKFITRDVDSHSGGAWKMFDRNGRRLGTYDANLNRIGP